MDDFNKKYHPKIAQNSKPERDQYHFIEFDSESAGITSTTILFFQRKYNYSVYFSQTVCRKSLYDIYC